MSVYALLLTQEPLGVREVARQLGFSSPSLAQHHLNKLSELGLIEKDLHGEYRAVQSVSVGALSLFVKVGSRLLPRFLFLATLVTVMLAAYLLLFFPFSLSGEDVMFISLSTMVIVFVVYEARRIWKLRPF
jgi:hypothetical protein